MEELRIMNTTLLIVVKDNNVLLAKKKRGFGNGKINGIGGKQDKNETIDEAMIRETQEEIGITPTKYKKQGVIDYDELYKGERLINRMYIYSASEFSGEPKESDEMEPIWFDIDKIPYNKMFPDDKIWYPLFLSGKLFKGFFKFDENFNLSNYALNEAQEDEIK